ncbi:MAG: DNA translocase FtsK 4TM domain-containing protein, partial [Muribaculaceae bacterium]|nr:DNA translocase FtsK 4TM domain-containing protein [Muribaculaceae bacterium]
MDNYEIYTPHIETEEPPVITHTPDQVAEEDKSRKGKSKPTRNKTTKKVKQPKQSDDKSISELVESVKSFFTSPGFRAIVGLFLGCLAIYLLIAFISYFSACIKDQSIINSTPVGEASRIANHGGEGGARLSEFLINRSFGVGSFVIIIWLGAMCLKLLTGHPRFKSVNFTIKCFVALITVSLIVGITGVVTNTYVNWGGYHAHYVYEYINNFFGYGSYILCFFMVGVFVLICLNDLVAWIRRKYAAYKERRRIIAEEKAAERARQEALRRDAEEEKNDDIRAGESIAVNTGSQDSNHHIPQPTVPFEPYVLDDLPEEDI